MTSRYNNTKQRARRERQKRLVLFMRSCDDWLMRAYSVTVQRNLDRSLRIGPLAAKIVERNTKFTDSHEIISTCGLSPEEWIHLSNYAKSTLVWETLEYD